MISHRHSLKGANRARQSAQTLVAMALKMADATWESWKVLEVSAWDSWASGPGSDPVTCKCTLSQYGCYPTWEGSSSSCEIHHPHLWRGQQTYTHTHIHTYTYTHTRQVVFHRNMNELQKIASSQISSKEAQEGPGVTRPSCRLTLNWSTWCW